MIEERPTGVVRPAVVEKRPVLVCDGCGEEWRLPDQAVALPPDWARLCHGPARLDFCPACSRTLELRVHRGPEPRTIASPPVAPGTFGLLPGDPSGWTPARHGEPYRHPIPALDPERERATAQALVDGQRPLRDIPDDSG